MRVICALVVLAGLAAAASADEAPQAARPPRPGDAWALPEAGSCSPKGGRLSPGKPEDATPVPFQTGDVFERGPPGRARELPARVPLAGARPLLLRGHAPRDRPLLRRLRAAGVLRGGHRCRTPARPASTSTAACATTRRVSPSRRRASRPAPRTPGSSGSGTSSSATRRPASTGASASTDLVGRIGRAEPFTGEMFKLILSHRADRPGAGPRVAERAGQRVGGRAGCSSSRSAPASTPGANTATARTSSRRSAPTTCTPTCPSGAACGA